MSEKDVPAAYRDLLDEPGPRMLKEALRLYGTLEVGGDGSNPTILAWAQEIGGWVADFYKDDQIPWCGLFVGIVAKRAGKPYRQDMLGARNWMWWGNQVDGLPVLGDVLVFTRGAGGHVGLYVGEDEVAYHVLGGNQSDSVNVTRVLKGRLLAARNYYAIGQPSNCRRIFRSKAGEISTNEA
jgi:uncharacterized protein (TIGR02594 family)